jgi:hypothetical protein
LRASDGALTVMQVNKQLTASSVAAVALTNFASQGSAQVWQLTAANSINRLADLSFSGNTLTNSLPPQSLTLLIIPPLGNTPNNSLRIAGQIAADGFFRVIFPSRLGQTYRVERSEDLDASSWSVVAAGLAGTGNSVEVTDPVPLTAAAFYRVVLVP